MGEENQNEENGIVSETETNTSESSSPTTATGSSHCADDVNKEIKDTIIARSACVRAKVVERETDDEINKRVDMVIKVLRKRDEVRKELNKMSKPPKLYAADGKEVEQLFDKATFESIKKKREELAKIDKAIDLALGEKADYSKLKEIPS